MVRINVKPPRPEDVHRIQSTAQTNRTNRDSEARGLPPAQMPSFDQDIDRLASLVSSLQHISCSGSLTLRVVNGSYRDFSGELTTYAGVLASKIEGVVNRIDSMVSAIARTYRVPFRVTITMTQTMEYVFKR